MEKEILDELLEKLKEAIQKKCGKDWEKGGYEDLQDDYIVLLYELESNRDKPAKQHEAINTFKEDHEIDDNEEHYIDAEEEHDTVRRSSKRKAYTEASKQKPKKQKADGYMSRNDFNTELRKAFITVKHQTIKKVLSSPEVADEDRTQFNDLKEAAFKTLEDGVELCRNKALGLFDEDPIKAQAILRKYKDNMKIFIGQMFGTIAEQFPLRFHNSRQEAYFNARHQPINWNLRDIYDLSHLLEGSESDENDEQFRQTLEKVFKNEVTPAGKGIAGLEAYDSSMSRGDFNTKISVALHNIKYYNNHNFLSSVKKASKDLKVPGEKEKILNECNDLKDKALAEFKKDAQNYKRKALHSFDEDPSQANTILERFKSRINILIRKIYKDCSVPIHDYQRKKFDEQIDQFLSKKFYHFFQSLNNIVSTIDITQKPFFINLRTEIATQTMLAKENFAPGEDKQNSKTLYNFRIEILSIIYQKISELKLELKPNPASGQRDELFNNFESVANSLINQYQQLLRKLHYADRIENTEDGNPGISASAAHNINNINGNNQLHSHNPPETKAAKLTIQENTAKKHNAIEVNIDLIKDFINLPEFVRKIFTKLNEIVDTTAKEIEKYCSVAKAQFIIIPNEELATPTHTTFEEIAYQNASFATAHPKVNESYSKALFEFIPEQVKIDVSSLIEENSANGVLNEILHARDIYL